MLPAPRSVTTHMELFFVAVTRAMNWDLMASHVMVGDLSVSVIINTHFVSTEINCTSFTWQILMSAVIRVTCASTSVSTNLGSSPVYVRKDTSC